MKYRFPLALAFLFTAFLGVVFALQAFEHPPVLSAQSGFRGTGMVQVANPRIEAALWARNQLPEAPDAASAEGDRASEIYENVPLLGHLSIEQFGRIMQVMTEWVSPEAGCNGCHVEGNFASDDNYRKQVARRMIEMVRHVNNGWTSHVQQTGVTCYTCHRGRPVPEQVWAAVPEQGARGMAASPRMQNRGEPSVGLTSLPHDPFSHYLQGSQNIRLQGPTPLASGTPHSVQNAESVYGLMINLSSALGVNCTFCHNTRAFSPWDESRGPRLTAWHGIRMVRDLNNNYVGPLRDILPADRRGPLGDALQVNCATCHQGVSRPLLGAPMLRDYPELAMPPAR
ncbi:photosynthetic reaction center cytochrome PufC [Humitalea sp. 24SJ18S-53]|uniref:photosynthetic reaction center cytochrome PufC n=1 Tax=Humitalea sp. 24SJ18S-53 TaxID=3422307 RepID=UPI003D67C948